MTPFASPWDTRTFSNVKNRITALLTLALGSGFFAGVEAAEFTPEQIEFFETKVRPLLAERCYDCHSGTKAKSGLELDSQAGILKGSDYRKVIDLAEPAKSPLILAVKHTGAAQKISNMPKKGDKLSYAQVADLEQWIAMGLPWPEPVEGLTDSSNPEDHWSFQSVTKSELPADYQGHPIDFFIRKKLAEAKLEPADTADRYTLYRRAHFGLLGLPPKYEELQEFVKDPRPDDEAWPEMTDHLLGSPHYGERMARLWMDVARYSDTKGYEAGGRERRFVYSHVYRDWLIRSFNEDLPYDRFVLYQLAADRLVDRKKPEKKHLAAMGFLTLSKNGNSQEVFDDRIDTTFRGLQGLTVSCARCHNHKFDPISIKEYYGIYGIFLNSVAPKDPPVIGEPKSGPEYEAYLKDLAKEQKVVDDFLEPKLAELAKKHPEIANRRIQLIGKLDRADRRKLQNLQKVVDKFVADAGMEPDKALILVERPGKPAAQPLFIRGNPSRRGEIVPRRFLTILAGDDAPEYTEDSGRLDMAKAIADSKNPLTARVIVNRIWMQHFGEGLVRTVSDFGTQGEAPTHPELLDWLATWFVDNGWSIKELHRLILTSDTWRQSSVHPQIDSYASIDPENRLLWRQNRRRLEFEQMRDGVLDVAHNLDNTLYGRSVKMLEPPFSNRRTVYAFIDRQNLTPTFRHFDFSNPQQHTGKRPSTTIPMQALFTMNSGFMQEQARNLTKAGPVQEAKDPQAKVQALHRAVLARKAQADEAALGKSFVERFSQAAAEFGKRQTMTDWQYGWGKVNEKTGAVTFKPFTHWTGERWQVGKEMPLKNDPRSYLHFHKGGGGHPGSTQEHCTILRWTAPEDMTVQISGKVERPSVGKGNGIGIRVVQSGKGVIARRTLSADRKAVDVKENNIAVKAGETLDFIVDPFENNLAFDGYTWKPEIRNAENSAERWNPFNPFAEPADPMTAWESYAQALLSTNAFQFID